MSPDPSRSSIAQDLPPSFGASTGSERACAHVVRLCGEYHALWAISHALRAVRFLASCRYSRYVSRSVAKIDTLLKVIMTPEDPAEEFVKHYLLLVPCQSFSDFQKVLDLKVSSCSGFTPYRVQSASDLAPPVR